jgi:hypothetical protein
MASESMSHSESASVASEPVVDVSPTSFVSSIESSQGRTGEWVEVPIETLITYSYDQIMDYISAYICRKDLPMAENTQFAIATLASVLHNDYYKSMNTAHRLYLEAFKPNKVYETYKIMMADVTKFALMQLGLDVASVMNKTSVSQNSMSKIPPVAPNGSLKMNGLVLPQQDAFSPVDIVQVNRTEIYSPVAHRPVSLLKIQAEQSGHPKMDWADATAKDERLRASLIENLTAAERINAKNLTTDELLQVVSSKLKATPNQTPRPSQIGQSTPARLIKQLGSDSPRGNQLIPTVPRTTLIPTELFKREAPVLLDSDQESSLDSSEQDGLSENNIVDSKENIGWTTISHPRKKFEPLSLDRTSSNQSRNSNASSGSWKSGSSYARANTTYIHQKPYSIHGNGDNHSQSSTHKTPYVDKYILSDFFDRFIGKEQKFYAFKESFCAKILGSPSDSAKTCTSGTWLFNGKHPLIDEKHDRFLQEVNSDGWPLGNAWKYDENDNSYVLNNFTQYRHYPQNDGTWRHKRVSIVDNRHIVDPVSTEEILYNIVAHQLKHAFIELITGKLKQ